MACCPMQRHLPHLAAFLAKPLAVSATPQLHHRSVFPTRTMPNPAMAQFELCWLIPRGHWISCRISCTRLLNRLC
ncbi:hypothetical protein M441DRAFT_324164 [Trichoderma asperellum CBS 433.97]|uniref:Uncharacterized protein n=1 Tax=Trichoderma asperellum (strain ATCC 204424 / CBS 433.97 / NBRC 101777) TaxID=1042311 RepID=A0A2T3ZLS6_TRIA4|nr:hypothetical protein M441DRAFT_324164 [Trichoderma asperellum CBS 433.97]PTB45743.1 hypothetical protein M441DRAFT_324164 [Trichoderma asperellum CBS 433.97]